MFCIEDLCEDHGALTAPGLDGDKSTITKLAAGFHLSGEDSGIGLVEKERT